MGTHPPGATPTRLRGDARQNRDQILQAARQQFSRYGFDVAMQDVARAARVGVGTLYRRFPSREALVSAVVLDSLELAMDRIREARATEADAWSALERVMAEAAALQLAIDATLHGAGSRAELRTPEVLAGRRRLLDLFGEIVCEARTEGTLRADVGVGDVAMAVAMLAGVRPSTLPEGAHRRLLAMVMSGLRVDGTFVALPGEPVTREDYENRGH
ncbi:TetR/AcrR family transcriptional regulator [Streptomyces sp. VNUA24]|uniref:TetR/AcrR family transcriptional regulator n=1 Tax=Streptomyces sp. VNUA24 TaxID=3031131 RepID=UPI0023B80F21|nr:TetR/AcrR family transcriptional regulator [Streptomyces sp. VNUA24]WEH12947.1 helix-turn-helix domain containing protein [Streptomyces sp. VNUA24]